jgi:hypothetical protein
MNLNDLIRAVNDLGAGVNPVGVSDEVREMAASMVGRSVKRRTGQDQDLRPGDLVSLRSQDSNLDVVVLGRLDHDSDQQDDPTLLVGTVCTVMERLDDPLITSQPAFVVMVEAEGRPQRLWAYAGELVLESRRAE